MVSVATPPESVERSITALLDPGRFASWLQRQSPTRLLYDDDHHRCTLIVYLGDHGIVASTVTWRDVLCPALVEPVALPRWARAFVRAIDLGSPAFIYREVVRRVFAAVMADFADRERPEGFEGWAETRRAVA